MSSKSSIWLVLLLPILVVTAANAAPTISNCNRDIVDCVLSPHSDAQSPSVPEIRQITPWDSHLAGIAAELLKPPLGFTDSPVPHTHAKALPAVPAAFLMALIGFICVSLVKDRRVWLTALTGLLWAGQTGIQALPQLVTYLSPKKYVKQDSLIEPLCFHQIENSSRLRSDIEGTQYIGLLHHLAGIPNSKSALANGHPNTLITFNQNYQNPYGKAFSYLNKKKHTSQPPIILEQHSLNSLLNCLPSIAGQIICFSPAFFFAHLARGPPHQA